MLFKRVGLSGIKMILETIKAGAGVLAPIFIF
jgi:hypothetical protein